MKFQQRISSIEAEQLKNSSIVSKNDLKAIKKDCFGLR